MPKEDIATQIGRLENDTQAIEHELDKLGERIRNTTAKIARYVCKCTVLIASTSPHYLLAKGTPKSKKKGATQNTGGKEYVSLLRRGSQLN